ncbi:DoxX family protein [Sinorhizobium terangae]|uniref:DoxX family membrane protein n=1 Tax=Sinorhizobium terangae TaxID=110322 RepID=A0A6N7LKF5_SINTE|nr:DoxX family membrane protein [Sinorhizobium terangae]MBB4188913.1 putative oxidoreductase [Sinorhizobium terangae]MQX17836.1 DoxX family membrane protein [Sinorhizobium terangae]MQX18292.1 DoxX family membrane protein [Sinorhizobium terangae]MQX19235.1 DoxX family membrane protein [Sinorhizobium terangae]WFU51268.1 DoxX family membrane protein [Sinorhizobium terangae]
MTTMRATPMSFSRTIYRLHEAVVEWSAALPLSIVQLGSRVAVAEVFWQSAQTKLASWPVTLQLFAFEYRLPLLDPGLAALMATVVELSGAAMLGLGLLARLASLMLLGVVATIQIFVYPDHWVEHLMWTSLLLLILSRGAGVFSVDHVVARRIRAGG